MRTEDYEYGEYGEDGEESEEIVEEVSECIKTVFLALERSTLPIHERMMYVADLEFNDEYGLCPQDHSFWNGPFTEDDGAGLQNCLSPGSRLVRTRRKVKIISRFTPVRISIRNCS